MKKLLVVAIIVLFVGASVVPSMSSDEAVYGNPLPTEYKVGIKWNAAGASSNEIATWFEGCILKLWNSSSSYTIDNTNWIEVEIIGDTSINYNHSSGIYFSGDSNTGALCRIVHSEYIPYNDYYTIEMKPQFVSGWGAIGIIFNYQDAGNFNEVFMSWNNICHITYHQFVNGEIVGYWSVETSFSSGIHDLRLEVNNTDGICEIYVNGELEGIVDIRLPPSTVYVDDDFNESTPGWEYDHFDSIQDGIDAVDVGGTVFVYNGTYTEDLGPNLEHIRIEKSLTLLGESRMHTIINCPTGETGVWIRTDYVNITGFTIIGDNDPDSIGIYPLLNSKSITIEDCVLHNFADGVQYQSGCRNITVRNCITYNNTRRGGISFAWSDVSNFEISGCNSYSNTYGIHILSGSTNGLIFHNNFYGNVINAYGESNNIWYSSTLGEGNYYDDYAGEDNNGDSIGDIPYNISGGSNQDLYPLMYPWYPTHPETVYVDDDYDNSTPGWGYDRFNRIQYGINEVEGSTVYVYNGTYYEQIRINKSINLIGEGKNNTFIDGNNVGDVTVRIFIDNVNISGFTIQESGNGYSGLCTYANNTNISNNIVKSNGYHGITVRDFSGNNIILNNIVFDNQQNGINIQDGSKNNLISNNNISENGAQGLRLELSSFNTICENRITQNLDDGIALNHDSNNNTVINNYIAVNVDDGIQIYESNNNLILKNEIIENIETGIQITENSNNNQLYHNNILNNTLQANDLCNNYWDNGYPSGGNYWDDYTGDDLYSSPNQDIPGSDGIGDTPYNISGGSNQDLYPLMHPFELYYILNISAPSEVNEGELFNAVVTSIGGPVVPNATVEFNDELKLTDSDGRAYFIAPQVGADTYYDITATKEGYTGDSETILVKDVPVEFVSTFIFGRIDNLTTGGDVITFEAVNIWCMTLIPFNFNGYNSGELITISKNPKGFVGALLGVQLIFALCDAYIG